ncbi:MAG: hypothetical protein EP305_07715 [Bacteroidetes bacterium]|nr:MAG: hypothetical protein EP305_07715 [Bacteroidota bacterium]
MKTIKILFVLLMATPIFISTSCKKCKVDAVDVNSGNIVEDFVLYPKSGYMTSNTGGNYVFDGTNPSPYFADKFEVSLNGGAKVPVNWNTYTILANPIIAKCNASFERNVVIDHGAQTVTYTVKVTQCDNCKEERMTENYVLVPKFPSTYAVNINHTIVDKE